VYEKALELARHQTPNTDYEIDEQGGSLRLTSSGQIRVGQMTEDLGGMWTGPARSQDLVLQALTALHLFVRDRNYTVQNEKIHVNEEAIKRLDISPAWQRGLVQLLEMKEELPHSGDRETLAKISYQELFQRYLRLGGITRTLCETRNELERIYPLKVMKVPPLSRPKRRAGPVRLFPNAQKKWDALVTRVTALHQAGRPVVIGLRSIAAAELLSSILNQKKLLHALPTGIQNEDDAAILRKAGKAGAITLLVNQAGRGMAIPLPPVETKAGGLMVIIAEVSEARRHDRQFIQRCGTADTPGGYEYFLSLEDDVVRLFAPHWAIDAVTVLGWMGSWVRRRFLRLTQRAAERHYAKSRLRLLDMDRQTNRVLAFSGRSE
jgi:preprotein translocase subunit SecA